MHALITFIKVLIFALIVSIAVHFFLVQPYRVTDDGMLPAYRKGDIVLISRIPYFQEEYYRDDVVVYRSKQGKTLRRIVGLPGEDIEISDGILKIRGERTKLEELELFGTTLGTLPRVGKLDANDFFVLSDSGLIKPLGMIDIRHIVGKPLIKIWPLNLTIL